MAKKEHFELLKKGVEIWNKWRKKYPKENPDLFNVNLSFSNLNEINFRQANLWEANLKKAKLKNADLRLADLCFADISGADLTLTNLKEANLTEADFSWAKLHKAELKKTNLWGANLERADLSYADLSEANLAEANLSHVNLSYADLSGTNLTDANLSHANLLHARFEKAVLNKTVLNNAVIGWCVFGDVDISTLKGLDTARHVGPSTVGIDSLYRSKGNIPMGFLQKAGVPENLIASIAALTTPPMRFFSYYLGYGEQDAEFAKLLHEKLAERGIRTWLEIQHDTKAKTIEQIIRFYDKVILVLSEHSMKDDWMGKLVKAIFDEERKTKKKKLFPLRMDSAIAESSKGWASDLRRSRQVDSFEEWRDSAAFEASLKSFMENMGYKPDANPSSPQPISQKSRSKLNFPETIYKITGENNCPLYELGDKLKLFKQSVVFPEEKPACVILIEDIIDAYIKYQSMDSHSGYSFICSGCTGVIRLAFKKDEKPPSMDTLQDPDSDIESIVRLLSSFSMFQSLDESNIKYLISFLKLKRFEGGEVVLKKGEPGKNLYIIVSGKVEVVGDAGISIAFMGKGEVFGEMSLLSGNPVGATVKVVEPSSILYLNAVDFRKIINKFPSLQMYFTRLLARRLAEIHDVRSEEFASGMVGKLSEIPPSELFQILNMNQKTGTLTLELSRGPANLAFREGSLVQARYDGKEDSDAFYDILKEKEGRFKFIQGLRPDEMELDEIGDFMLLLMEGIRRIDEN